MIIEKINDAKKVVEHSIEGNSVNFRNGELVLDLSKYEREFDVILDMTENQFGMLQMGLSKTYVAQVFIPARTYAETIVNEGTEEEKVQRVANEFNIEKCELRLWEVN